MMAAVVVGAAPSPTIAAAGAGVDQIVDQTTSTLAAGDTSLPRLDATTTIVGQLVESACYMQRGAAATAPEHAKCATMCAQKGHRLGVVTLTGDVFMVTGILTQDNNAKLIPLIQRMVVLTGTVNIIQVSTTSTASPVLLDPKADARRLDGTEVGVIEKKPTKTADFREGDVMDGVEMTIDAITADLAPVRLQ
ncbi:MAG TPA: hypothetical protein VGQ16_04060 [Vicinamibacterales bacterium]|nr:hypothetical protein [Vicinamibacterales bacterium]